jgi:CDP-glycerol glycerophosphotransferase
MRRLKLFIKVVVHLLNAFFFNLVTIFLNLFVRKDSKVIVVGGWFGKRFADNSRYFFLYLNKHKAVYGLDKIIWITRSDEIYDMLQREGFDVAKAWSLKSIYFHLKAKYHVIDQYNDDINGYFSFGSVRINLWHGFPVLSK